MPSICGTSLPKPLLTVSVWNRTHPVTSPPTTATRTLFALYGTTDVKSPLAERVFDMWRYGQSAYIPSVAQMRLLYHAKDIINPYILKCGGTPIPDEDDDCWYWTSTEVEGQATAKAWLYSLGSGAIQETPKWQPHKARPIITIMD